MMMIVRVVANPPCFRLDTAPQQYLIRFLRDRAAYWQERSLGALKAFAPARVQLD